MAGADFKNASGNREEQQANDRRCIELRRGRRRPRHRHCMVEGIRQTPKPKQPKPSGNVKKLDQLMPAALERGAHEPPLLNPDAEREVDDAGLTGDVDGVGGGFSGIAVVCDCSDCKAELIRTFGRLDELSAAPKPSAEVPQQKSTKK